MPNPTKPTTNLTREELLIENQNVDTAGSVVKNEITGTAMKTIMQYVDTYIKTKVDENSKAYGGCLDCYGKGYATQESATIGYPDFVGDKGFKHREHKMIFCECPRGRQLRSEIALQADKENL